MPSCRFWGYLFCLVFSELPGSVTLCLSLILETFQLLLVWTLPLVCLSFFCLVLSLGMSHSFHNCHNIFGYSVLFVSLFFFSLHFSLGNFYWHMFKLTGPVALLVSFLYSPLLRCLWALLLMMYTWGSLGRSNLGSLGKLNFGFRSQKYGLYPGKGVWEHSFLAQE